MRLGKTDVPAPRQHGLDVVRAAAIVAVMLYHANTMKLMPGPAPWLVNFGWMGVDLFFVLSGFLIAGQLLKPLASGAKPEYARFFLRRALRTIPAFAVVLALYFLFPRLRETPAIQPFWQFATFTENLLFDPTTHKAFDQVWSLCVEEQFYLLFPLALSLMAIRPSARKTVSVLVAIVLGGMLLRGSLWQSQSSWQDYVTLIYYPTWSRLDGLISGIALATLKIFRPAAWQRFVAQPNLLIAAGFLGAAGAMFVFGGPVSPAISAAFGFPLISASAALLVAAASTGQGLIGKYRVPGAQALATGAYSLYLTHKMAYHAVQAWLSPALGATGYLAFAIAIFGALLAGAFLYWSVERPFLLMRDRLSARVFGKPRMLELFGKRDRAVQPVWPVVGN